MNEENLKPFQSVEEAREKGRKGGIASGQARREKKLFKEGKYISDNQIWEIIIEKSMVKDDVINTLLGLIH